MYPKAGRADLGPTNLTGPQTFPSKRQQRHPACENHSLQDIINQARSAGWTRGSPFPRAIDPRRTRPPLPSRLTATEADPHTRHAPPWLQTTSEAKISKLSDCGFVSRYLPQVPGCLGGPVVSNVAWQTTLGNCCGRQPPPPCIASCTAVRYRVPMHGYGLLMTVQVTRVLYERTG